MIRRSGPWLSAVVMFCIAVLGGCSNAAKAGRSNVSLALTPALVMPGRELVEMELQDDRGFDADHFASVVYGRNDALLGSYQGDRSQPEQWVLVRHREHLRISNGRSREFSTTFTESIKRGFGR